MFCVPSLLFYCWPPRALGTLALTDLMPSVGYGPRFLGPWIPFPLLVWPPGAGSVPGLLADTGLCSEGQEAETPLMFTSTLHWHCSQLGVTLLWAFRMYL
ncbi:hypothetical protein H1C71_029366 [Ictidomys tridecemlineatus]|nr:hypothetical protein H1C71_029366 [Ictidomys tridecemlineatus]